MSERLQKVLARAGVGSRRHVEQLIRAGRITVNGRTAELGERADLESDAVKVDGKRIRPAASERRYVLLNKPRGCVSTTSDPEGRPTVLDLVPQRLRPGLVPVGRLDYDTEGLLLLTDDGELAHRLAHPRYGCAKTYEVRVKGRPPEAAVDRLRGGMVIDGRRTVPASVVARSSVPAGRTARKSSKNSWWTVVLKEGRTRQIREMFFRIGHPVGRLRRVAIGPLAAGQLPRGGWRQLEEREVASLRRAVGLEDPSAKEPRAAKRRAAKPPAGAGTPSRPQAKKPRSATRRTAARGPAGPRGGAKGPRRGGQRR